MACKLVDPVSGYAIVIQQWQWGYRQGTEYLIREWGETGAGVQWRERIPYVERQRMVIRFAGDRAMAEKLRAMTYLVMEVGTPVQFFPDLASTEHWWVDWPQTLDNAYTADWRHEITLDLPENLTGPDVPVVIAFLSQFGLEAMVYIGDQTHLSQMVVEVGLQPATQSAHLSQMVIEVPLQPAAQSAHLSQFVLEVMAKT